MSAGASEVTRREMLAALARWSAPTVVTLALGARAAQAASCPPCYKRSGATCKACSVSQILNCNCEPCLGPPYCSSGSGAPPVGRSTPGGLDLGGPRTQQLPPSVLRELQRERRRRVEGADQLYRDPFGIGRREPGSREGLFERLRGTDTTRVRIRD